jgi:5-methylcytosine-specific restriction endonuclease McrA
MAYPKPKRIDYKLRWYIWERDKGTCQKCKKQLYELIDPYEEAIEELQNLHEIKIYKWIHKCWKCGKETPIVTYDLGILMDNQLGTIKKLDEMLMQKYSFVNKKFSKTQQAEDVANTCINCGALQGNFFLVKELLLKKADGQNMDELVDITFPNDLEPEDLQIERGELTYEEKSSYANVHHIDGNRSNNNLENLILLCRQCHMKTHSELRKIRKN